MVGSIEFVSASSFEALRRLRVNERPARRRGDDAMAPLRELERTVVVDGGKGVRAAE